MTYCESCKKVTESIREIEIISKERSFVPDDFYEIYKCKECNYIKSSIIMDNFSHKVGYLHY